MAGGKSGRGTGLARRLRAALDNRLAAQRQAEADRQEVLAHGRRERVSLLRDLAAFGKVLGHCKVSSTDDGVSIRHDGHCLRFVADGDADRVLVSGDGLPEGTVLQLNAELQRWALHPARGGPKLFFDAGLEDLIARVFDLRPVEEDRVDQSQDLSSADKPEPTTAARKRSL